VNKNQINIFLDIETAPTHTTAGRDYLQDRINKEIADVKAPGNYTKPDTISAYIEQKRGEIRSGYDQAWRKTALDGSLGHLAVIGWAVNDEPTTSVEISTDALFSGADDFSGELALIASEKYMLTKFFADIAQYYESPEFTSRPVIIGHNVHGFDLQFMYKRAVILGVKPPSGFPFNAPLHSPMVYDTMTTWAGRGNYISLDSLSKVLGLPGKSHQYKGQTVTGALVWDMIQAGDIDKVAEYCRDGDIEMVRAIHKRMTFA